MQIGSPEWPTQENVYTQLMALGNAVQGMHGLLHMQLYPCPCILPCFLGGKLLRSQRTLCASCWTVEQGEKTDGQELGHDEGQNEKIPCGHAWKLARMGQPTASRLCGLFGWFTNPEIQRIISRARSHLKKVAVSGGGVPSNGDQKKSEGEMEAEEELEAMCSDEENMSDWALLQRMPIRQPNEDKLRTWHNQMLILTAEKLSLDLG